MGARACLFHDEVQVIPLERIQAVDPRAARCRVFMLPTPLFQWLASSLLLVSPKTFEALLQLSVPLEVGGIRAGKLPGDWPLIPLLCGPLALVGLLVDRLNLPVALRYGAQLATAIALLLVAWPAGLLSC